MPKNQVIIAIDNFKSTEISGWCVIYLSNTIIQCPITIIINNKEFINIENFYFREDVKNSNIGTGLYGFSVKRNIEIGDHVEIYKKDSIYKLWEGFFGSPHKKFSRIDICNSENQLKNSEECLININNELTSNTQSKHILAYKLNISIENNPIYYFQTIHNNSNSSFNISINGFIITKNIYGKQNNQTFSEYFLISKNSEKIKNPLTAKVSFEEEDHKEDYHINILDFKKDKIFLFTNDNNTVIRPNKNINIIFNTPTPLIIRYENINPFSIVKNSIIMAKNNGEIYWSPIHVIDNQILINSKNIVSNNFLYNNKINIDHYKNVNNLFIHYKKHGDIDLIKKIYLDILGREGDEEGINDCIRQFNNDLKNNEFIHALYKIINRFIESEEYKNKYFYLTH